MCAIPASTATRCQHQWRRRGSEVNKFVHVANDVHQMSLGQGQGQRAHEVSCLFGVGSGPLNSKVQWIMSNGHMDIPCG